MGDVDAARRALRAREVSAVELAEAALARADSLQPTIGAFATVTPELALAQAERADRHLAAGEDRGPFHGLPVAVKDVIDVAGVPTRLGTPRAGHRTPTASACVVDALAAAGAVVIGKTASHELAFGMVTPQARNPFDPRRIVGGSSGGSAAAVAAGIVAAALGTDTNGSVRCPAALCGVVGLRPTSGAISRAGVAPLAWTQDTVGPLAYTAGDCAALLAVLAGRAPTAAPGAGARLRVGVDRAAWGALGDGVEEACAAALAALAAGGVEVVDVALPDAALAGAASIVVLMGEASSAWGPTLDADPGGFGAQVRAALTVGRDVPAGAYLRAKRVRALLARDLRALFAGRGLHAVATPTVPITAAPAGAATVALGGREQPIDAVHSRFAALAALVGHPALSVPCGLDASGLPIGLQLMARPDGEPVLAALGARVEAAAGALAVAAARPG